MDKEFVFRKELTMLSSFILNLFLYFPEDKTEYIPAGITMAIFMIAALFTFRIIQKASKREELKTKRMEEEARVQKRTE
jgi:flagellar biosynthesis/type III secretory pathway M-ring protein FliF/YscJ